MKRPRYGNAVTVLALLAGLSGPGLAGSEDVVVADAWPRATIGMNRPGAACLTLRNTGDADVTVIEGHVPASDIQRLLEDRPDAVGLAAPDMPYGPTKVYKSYPDS
tara:strand:- start:1144 stop:1461 length:318 start_codon:yes stop_codon:yes gene_type:complete